MLSRISKEVMWTTLGLKNSVAESSHSDGLNQTPLNLANAVMPQPDTIEYPHPLTQQAFSYSSFRNGQTNIDGLAPYLEYIFAAALAIPVALMVYFGFKKLDRAARGYHRKPQIISLQSVEAITSRPVVARKQRAPVVKPSSELFSSSVADLPGARTNNDTESTSRNRTLFVKTAVRQEITKTIREKIAQRREAAATAKKDVKQPVSLKIKLPRPKPVALASPVVSSMARVSTALKTSSPVSVRRPPELPKRKTLQAQLELVRENATELAKFSERFHEAAEEKMDAAALQVKYLLGMYRLHRYNLSVLELMCHRPTFLTEHYAALIVPLRLEFAHFSSDISQQAITKTLAALRADLVHFLKIQSQLSTTSLRDFIENMSQRLLKTALLQQCIERLPVIRARKVAEKNSQADAAYQEFVNVSLPSMQVLAENILSFPKNSTSEDQDFSYAEQVQAFGMLVMRSCDHLPVHVLMRLRNNAEGYSESVLLLMSKVHNLRNMVAHRLEALPQGAVISLCERVGRMGRGLQNVQNEAVARPLKRDAFEGRFFGVGSRLEEVTSSPAEITRKPSRVS